MQIRTETENDCESVRSLNKSAFEGDAEASLVDGLRRNADPIISLVAEEGGELLGHILFSPVTHSDDADLKLMGLAPMAVAPGKQRCGIGSALIDAGLERCKELQIDGVVVLGHPHYYPRFGFLPSSNYGIVSEYDVPEDVFMVLELRPGALHGKSGRVHYHSEFGNL